MKTPRVNDFDPDAKVPSLKSPLEGMPTIGKPPKVIPQEPPTPSREEKTETPPAPDRPIARSTDESIARSPDRVTNKRNLMRRAFEWYEDQLASLKRLSLQEQMEGKDGSMSAMVREALDDYLKKRSLSDDRSPDR
jgi:hypothetical protein